VRTAEQFFTVDNRHDEREELSPSGKYRVVLSKYKTKPGAWDYTRAEIYDAITGVLLGDVKRNYSTFWHCWCENHPDGHDYFVGGEDYQGQTVIRLDTRERRNFLPAAAKDGFGFCWATMEPSEDKLRLHVNGCYWAGPYENVVYDFARPLDLPYKELSREY